MLWSLDEPRGDEHTIKPVARFNGIELSSTSSIEPIEEIFGKRFAADELDQNISRIKRRRTKDVSPYVSLAKKDQHLQILREYMPPAIVEKIEKEVPKEVRQAALSMTRRLSQEYRYHLYNRIIKNHCFSIPKLAVLEDLERGVLALQADKLQITLLFLIESSTEYNITDDYEMCINISRYVFPGFSGRILIVYSTGYRVKV
jgi:hypothetical protein